MTQKHSDRMRRLTAAGLLPERAGQPVKAWAHISLADLMRLDGELRAAGGVDRAGPGPVGRAPRRRVRRPAADGGAWLDGDAAEAIACDAAMAPIVTGDVNVDALEDLVRLCVELDAPPGGDGPPGTPRPGPRSSRPSSARPSTCCPARAGWRSFLRRRQLGARLGGPSLPLDIGYAETIPAGIRNAVTLRDQHCQWAGGATSPPRRARCTTPSTRPTAARLSVKDCVLLCWFHHQVVIHRWGWTLVLNPDGTTTAWNKDKTKVLHSHGPPVRPG